MYRDDADLELLTELAGVLDETVTNHDLSSGSYLVLRELSRATHPTPITATAEAIGADAEELIPVVGSLLDAKLVARHATGVQATDGGKALIEHIDASANEAMRIYILERPHTATVYGLVAAMQSGRFTVNDLVDFIQETPEDDENEGE